jgi:hypothetical protein
LHFAANGCEDEARLGEKIDQKVSRNTGSEHPPRNDENHGESGSEQAGCNGGPDRNAKAAAHDTPDTVRGAKDETRSEDLQNNPALALVLQIVHYTTAEDNFFEDASSDGYAKREYF